MAKYVYLGEGNKFTVSTGVEQIVTELVDEGGMVEVQLHFSSRFEGFENAAITLDNNLRMTQVEGEYMQPWKGNYQIVYVDPVESIFYVRYLKGIAWGVWLAACVIALSIAWVAFTLWKVFSVIPGVVADNPWLIPVVALGLTATIVMNAVGKLRTSEVRTSYGAGLKYKEEVKYK